jgi:hypothetical protein
VVVSAHIDEVTLEDVPHEFGTADASVVEEDPVAAVESIDAVAVVEEHTVEEHVVEEHEVEEHKVEEHIVPEHVVEEHVVPGPVEIADDPVASSDLQAAQFVDEDATASAAPPEHNEAPDEQIADLSEDDDSVTGASNEADNSDAEPTR